MGNFVITNNTNLNSSNILDSINLAKNYITTLFKQDEINFALSFLRNEPVKGEKIFKDNQWIILFAGDILDSKNIPFNDIKNSLLKENFKYFESLNGIFCIAAYKINCKKFFLISDKRAQHPFYYSINNGKVFFSTELSSFCRLTVNPEFNINWLYDILFFHFPVNNVTFLKEVKSIPPASIIIYEQDSCKINIIKYSENFKKKDTLLKDDDALEFAQEVFHKRVKSNFSGAEKIACALTQGWDSRTNIALAPDKEKITTFTYGIPHCHDLIYAKKTAKVVKVKHIEIPYDEAFIKNIPQYALETLYLSSGSQGIRRSSLIYVYDSLKKLLPDHAINISGIIMDTIFRGHLGLTVYAPQAMINMIKSGNILIEDPFWRNLFKVDSNLFSQEIENSLHILKNEFGDFRTNEFYLTYILYFAAKYYFLGEFNIARNFTTLRVTAWDNEIIDLAHSIKYSCISTSRRPKKEWGSRDELMLQSYLIKNCFPALSNLQVKETKPNVVLTNDFIYNQYKTYSRVLIKLKKMLFHIRKLEEWDTWINANQKFFIDDLLGKNALINEYLNLELLKNTNKLYDSRFQGKLLTVEIILRLIKNRWQRFW